MNALNPIQNIYFLGIGGIGMSALAQYFVLKGKNVAGYDKTHGKMTHKLEASGMSLSFDDDPNTIPEDFYQVKNTLVVYTPAVPQDLNILNYFREREFRIEKRSKVLGDITKTMPTLAITGTHGKTTTSAILAHLLKTSGYDITAFLGGISENYHSNFIGEGSDACVVEADEFDRSFLKIYPDYAGITSMDPDHLDIYGNAEEMRQSFHQFVEKVNSDDRLFHKKGLPLKGHSISIDQDGDYSITDIKIEKGSYVFTLNTPTDKLKGFSFTLPGKHNLMNAGMALAMALKFGAKADRLKLGLAQFKGVDRRFTYHIKSDQKVLIEDYAHHPKEIEAVYQAVREMHPGQQVTVVFQPHLYSRTQDFAKEFAHSLSPFDEVILLPIYPAREEPIPGIDSDFLLGLIDNSGKKVIEKKQIAEAISNSRSEVFLLLGAGDIECFYRIEKIIRVYEEIGSDGGSRHDF